MSLSSHNNVCREHSVALEIQLIRIDDEQWTNVIAYDSNMIQLIARVPHCQNGVQLK